MPLDIERTRARMSVPSQQKEEKTPQTPCSFHNPLSSTASSSSCTTNTLPKASFSGSSSFYSFDSSSTATFSIPRAADDSFIQPQPRTSIEALPSSFAPPQETAIHSSQAFSHQNEKATTLLEDIGGDGIQSSYPSLADPIFSNASNCKSFLLSSVGEKPEPSISLPRSGQVSIAPPDPYAPLLPFCEQGTAFDWIHIINTYLSSPDSMERLDSFISMQEMDSHQKAPNRSDLSLFANQPTHGADSLHSLPNSTTTVVSQTFHLKSSEPVDSTGGIDSGGASFPAPHLQTSSTHNTLYANHHHHQAPASNLECSSNLSDSDNDTFCETPSFSSSLVPCMHSDQQRGEWGGGDNALINGKENFVSSLNAPSQAPAVVPAWNAEGRVANVSALPPLASATYSYGDTGVRIKEIWARRAASPAPITTSSPLSRQVLPQALPPDYSPIAAESAGTCVGKGAQDVGQRRPSSHWWDTHVQDPLAPLFSPMDCFFLPTTPPSCRGSVIYSAKGECEPFAQNHAVRRISTSSSAAGITVEERLERGLWIIAEEVEARSFYDVEERYGNNVAREEESSFNNSGEDSGILLDSFQDHNGPVIDKNAEEENDQEFERLYNEEGTSGPDDNNDEDYHPRKKRKHAHKVVSTARDLNVASSFMKSKSHKSTKQPKLARAKLRNKQKLAHSISGPSSQLVAPAVSVRLRTTKTGLDFANMVVEHTMSAENDGDDENGLSPQLALASLSHTLHADEEPLHPTDDEMEIGLLNRMNDNGKVALVNKSSANSDIIEREGTSTSDTSSQAPLLGAAVKHKKMNVEQSLPPAPLPNAVVAANGCRPQKTKKKPAHASV